ncbi:hypothetical protein EV652_10218 [Kribbella steppae]|uniref:4-amino-4-deoxy-L-arabinose transferase-like glycosyltransferase n=1 Tax=Kribbella steppae TaxID=2512223 RepID=A0A4R2HRT9_9ACTN|nr:hypothetical protein [Kribbella steppae]TCO33954.1 hypothetical protein EV652_10218 [Kribbella steppae]
MRRSLPWLLPLVVAALGLIAIDVPPGPIVKYCVYFALAIALPGTLLLRAAWRSTGNWAEDLGLGSVVGATWQLIGWAVFTALGWQRWLIVWPALVLVAFASVRRLRSNWRITQPTPLPVAWTWGLAVASTVVLGATTLGVMAYHEPPPQGSAYYQDLLYHLSMVNELMRTVPPELPQVAGERLEYHWFANADMAAAVDITRLTPIIVLFRLWLLPWLVVALLVSATLARTVSRTWWTGVLAAGALAAPQLHLFFDTSVNLSAPLSFLSPSQTFGMVACVAAAVFLIELLFKGARGWLWVVAFAVVVLGGGSKPTVLPVLVGAVGLASVVLLVQTRRVPARVVVAGALLVAIGAATMLTVAGSTSGSGLQFLAILKSSGDYAAATGDRTPAGEGGLIVPALAQGAVVGTLVLLCVLLIHQATALVGFGALGKHRREPVAWFLIGGLIAGWAGYLLIDHPSVSESYFIYTAIPFGLAAAGWLAATLVRDLPARTRTRSLVSALVLGTVCAGLMLVADAKPVGSQRHQLLLVARPLLVILVLAGLWWLLRQRSGAGLVVVLALLAVVPIKSFGQSVVHGDSERAQRFTSPRWWVYPDEVSAALWLGKNSAPTDVVAANTWCRPAGKQTSGCDARGYIVSGFAGRRTLIEGWAYTNEAMAQQGVGGRRYTEQPSPWPERVALTNEVLAAPTPDLLRWLRQLYHVRWLYADARDGTVSPALDRLAELRHSVGKVRIYDLGE